jgi:hypothetical protein
MRISQLVGCLWLGRMLDSRWGAVQGTARAYWSEMSGYGDRFVGIGRFALPTHRNAGDIVGMADLSARTMNYPAHRQQGLANASKSGRQRL